MDTVGEFPSAADQQIDPWQGGIFTVKERVGHRLVTTTQMALGGLPVAGGQETSLRLT
jgi:hypothetical protein